MLCPAMKDAHVTPGVAWCPAARTQVGLLGADRHKFLNNYCTADLRQLGVDSGCEAFMTSVQGKTLSYGLVWAHADCLVWDTDPGYGEQIFAHLDRYLLRDDVQLVDLQAQGRTQIWLAGHSSG